MLALNEQVDVPMMLRVVEREAQTLSQNKHKITFDIDHQIKVLGNEDQLRSAISNLVYNAVNHTPEGTKIAVRWQRVAHGVEFSVEDNGPELPPNTFRVSLSASIVWIKRVRDRQGAVASVWRL